MAHITVTIDAKQFRMACEDGQEHHLEKLADHLDSRVRMMRENFGEIGDLRLTVMAALMVCDEFFEERRKGEQLLADRAADRAAVGDAQESNARRDLAVAAAIDGLTARVERIARMLAAPPVEA